MYNMLIRLTSLVWGWCKDVHVCAVLLCLVVCLTLLASFSLPSHLSLKYVYNMLSHLSG